MGNPFRTWVERLRAAWQEQRRAEILRHLAELHRRARQLEAEYRDGAWAAAVLAPRVVPAVEGLAADAARTTRALARRIEELGGTVPPDPPRAPRMAETMGGHLSPAIDLERDLVALLTDGHHELRERDPATAEVLAQLRKDAATRERQLLDLAARL